MFTVMRTESPDNDSAFSDSISLISSESSTSSSTAPSTHNNQVRHTVFIIPFAAEQKMYTYGLSFVLNPVEADRRVVIIK